MQLMSFVAVYIDFAFVTQEKELSQYQTRAFVARNGVIASTSGGDRLASQPSSSALRASGCDAPITTFVLAMIP